MTSQYLQHSSRSFWRFQTPACLICFDASRTLLQLYMCSLPQPTQRYLIHPIPAICSTTYCDTSVLKITFFSPLQWETRDAPPVIKRWEQSSAGLEARDRLLELSGGGRQLGSKRSAPLPRKLHSRRKTAPPIGEYWQNVEFAGPSPSWPSHLHKMSHEIESGTERGLVQALGRPDL